MHKLIGLSIVTALAATTSAGCKTGNPQQRNDIIAAIGGIKPPLDNCYQIALARNRKTAGGFITVELIAEAGTGQFKNVIIRRDEVRDPSVRMCVINEVSKIKLPKPPDSNVQIPYAFRFTPVN
ncbi:MAG: AgmX/PglI C-terminal domain-containing protein [Kofleriaceae bacterium]